MELVVWGWFSHEMVIIRMENRSSTQKAPSWSLFILQEDVNVVKLNWGDIMHVTQNVAEEMAERLKNCLARIQEYNLDYDEIDIWELCAR